MRRQAEAVAQATLRRLRLDLEERRQAEAVARQRLGEAEMALGRTRQGERDARGGRRLPAGELQREADARTHQAEQVRARQAEVAEAEAAVRLCLRQVEAGQAHVRSCVARREAAELHEAEERREGRRVRAQRERAHEDEARDRFAIGRVK